MTPREILPRRNIPQRRSTDFERDPETVLGALYRLTKRFGLWAALATALIYVFVWELRSDIRGMRGEHWMLMQTLGAMCLNDAETTLEVERCKYGGAVDIPTAQYYK